MTQQTKADKTIARIAGRQLGIVTRDQLAEAAVSRHSLRRRVDGGRLTRLGPHTYLASGAPHTWKTSALAACLDLGGGAVLSHLSAGFVWQLGLGAPEVIEVTVPYTHSARRESAAVSVHRSRSLPRSDRVVVQGLPVTAADRTLVEIAGVVAPEVLAKCTQAALCQRLVSPSSLAKALDRLARGGRDGTAHIRHLLAPWLADQRLESVAEAAVLRAITEAGLPRPATQHQVDSPSGEFVARVDFAWPGRRVVLEVDGFRWHANPAAQVADSARASRLFALGWTVLRTTPAEVTAGPEGVLAAIRRALGTAA